MKIKMHTKRIRIQRWAGKALTLLILLTAIPVQAQIGVVTRENKSIVASSGDSKLALPFIEFTEITDKAPFYTLWYWDDTDSDRKIRSLRFHATDMELDYLYKVLKEGFSVSSQRVEVGNCRLVTQRPLRSGNPLKLVVYYEDDSFGTFYLRKKALERLLGPNREPVPAKTYLAEMR